MLLLHPGSINIYLFFTFYFSSNLAVYQGLFLPYEPWSPSHQPCFIRKFRELLNISASRVILEGTERQTLGSTLCSFLLFWPWPYNDLATYQYFQANVLYMLTNIFKCSHLKVENFSQNSLPYNCQSTTYIQFWFTATVMISRVCMYIVWCDKKLVFSESAVSICIKMFLVLSNLSTIIYQLLLIDHKICKIWSQRIWIWCLI